MVHLDLFSRIETMINLNRRGCNVSGLSRRGKLGIESMYPCSCLYYSKLLEVLQGEGGA